MEEETLNALMERIIGCACRVAEKLKYGYLEKVYENAMRVELERAGFSVAQQQRLEVWYEGVLVGDYCADLIVDGIVLLEIKTCKNIDEARRAVPELSPAHGTPVLPPHQLRPQRPEQGLPQLSLSSLKSV